MTSEKCKKHLYTCTTRKSLEAMNAPQMAIAYKSLTVHQEQKNLL